MNKIGNIKVESKNGNNIVNLYQVDDSSSKSSVQPKLEDFGIAVKKGASIILKVIYEAVAFFASFCTIAVTLGIDKGIKGFFETVIKNEIRLKNPLFWIALVVLGISISQFYTDVLTSRRTVLGARVYSSHTKRIYKLKMDKCPMCGRNSYPNIKPLDKTFFVLSCPKCGKEIKLSYSELMDFVEKDN